MHTLSQADILWVKLNRHSVQCIECATLRRERVGPAGDWLCAEARDLNAAMEIATAREKDETVKDMGFVRSVAKFFTFEAAHRLPNLPPEHPCSRLHGHSWRTEIHVRGNMDEKIGWIIDFSRIKEIAGPTIGSLDHRYLNEIPGLENPTSERVAEWLWVALEEKLRDAGVSLTKLIVQETCTSAAIIERRFDNE